MQDSVSALVEAYPKMMSDLGTANRVFSLGRRESKVRSIQCSQCYHVADSLPQERINLDGTLESFDKRFPENGLPCTHILENLESCEWAFRDVTFTYDSRPDVQILNGLHATFKDGETTAIVGGSGSGKSSCIKLMLGLYYPTGGVLFETRMCCMLQSLKVARFRCYYIWWR